ncbi:MAG: PTS lactose/cellobiose transporter subunit IIA [Chloroflexi bacterium]|jgi:PTS system cellobiose-specific IIA component|nr:PTS lactose/cellobiose transporter subunit IIA [Chloroflexota bacterium]
MSLADYEAIIFGIISTSGNAKSTAYEALREAKQGNFSQARETLKEVETILGGLHTQQMALIQKETNGEANEFSVLLVHALDIMMDSMAVRDMINELVDLYEVVDKLKGKE